MSAVSINPAPADGGAAPTDAPQVRTLLLTDLVDSTTLVERLGDGPAAALFREHDRLVLELQQRWRGRLIDRSDGLLLLFERPVDALGFALDYNRGLRAFDERPELKQRKLHLQARAGLHVGEVLTWRNSEAAVQAGAKPLEVEGIAKPLAGRLMTLARPGQILLSATAEPMAHRSARELGERSEHLIWKSHGRWRLKGVPDAQEIFEVGEPGYAPLRAPKENHAKAWRDIPLWRRPAALALELLLLAGIGTGAWFLTRPTPAIAFNERDWVVVGDLRNLTGDPRLDDSLDEAFRISLEQSNYVNLISDLKVRETLQRMQRKPDTAVDRAIGSEIALRDGARALLLATVAEVGGRLRVSAEVIDPRTQTTVYAVSADGKGIDSALASIDEVTDGLREKLGEALQSVEQTSVPLPNVSTPSLDALKAYALAMHTRRASGDPASTIGLLERAIQIDPQFALAHAGIGRVKAAEGDHVAAKQYWNKASSMSARLSPQEQQRLQLSLAKYGPVGSYFALSRQYLQLYPDDHDMHADLAQTYWHIANDFSAAEDHARRATANAAPNLALNHYTHGIMLLGLERYQDAIAAFRTSRQLGFTGAGTFYARAFDAQGRHADADRVYAQSTAGRKRGADRLWVGGDGVLTYVDRGSWQRAEDEARSALVEAQAGKHLLHALGLRTSLLKLRALGAEPVGVQVRQELAEIDRHADAFAAMYAPGAEELRLMLGLVAGMTGDAAAVQAALAAVEDSASLAAYPLSGQLHQVVLAEHERLAGNPAAAIARLQPIVRRGDALLVAHAGLMRALRAAGKLPQARVEAQWLAKHRGRAFAESSGISVLEEVNIAGPTLALLDDAEMAMQLGRRAEAAATLARFTQTWPPRGLPRALQARVARLEEQLSGARAEA